MPPNPSDGPSLEDHLRNLILSPNRGSGPMLSNAAPSHSTVDPHQSMPSESFSAPRGEAGDGQTPINAARVPRSGKKRPNQAQRRQMNAELSVPIDPVGFYQSGPYQSTPRSYGTTHHHGEPQSFQNGPQQNALSSQPTGFPGGFQSRPMPTLGHLDGQIRRGHGQPSSFSTHHQSDWRRQEQPNFDPISRSDRVIHPADAFPPRGGRYSFQPKHAMYNPRQPAFDFAQVECQVQFLDQLCYQTVAAIEIKQPEIQEKEAFRKHVEAICRKVVTRYEYDVEGVHEFPAVTVELKCFGSLASGFATKASDMDLGLVSPVSRLPPGSPESPIPRLIEEALLSAGFGARLLTKARVPILKLCQKPSIAFRDKLREARKKWEKGLEQDEREPDDDAPDDPDPNAIDTGSHETATKLHMAQSSVGAKSVPTGEEELRSLKQSGTQSLTAYYGVAKRVLHLMNGRDVTHSNSQEFTKADYQILDMVAEAFVNGLHDSELKARILAFPSFRTDGITQLTNYRSLSGVYTMAEGEKLVLSWEKWRVSSSQPGLDLVYEKVVEQWHNSQHKKNFGTNPIWFNKELQLALEGLRQSSPLQMSELQQDPHETPAHYYERTVDIAERLFKISSRPNAATYSHVLYHYADGIRDKGMKNDILQFICSTDNVTLSTAARKHKALHLATEYEKAVQEGLYCPEDVSFIQTYIPILRRQAVRSVQRPVDPEHYIPMLLFEAGILERIRKLPDPATLGSNKPRDRYGDSLEFPKNGVGVQCDVNFSAHLALQNTTLLRCYSRCDPRVKPLVLFVKHWAKIRDINTPYRGTLSSYGYVLMVLHYLVNVVEPFVCPNLQLLAPTEPSLRPEAIEEIVACQGYNVHFWRDEEEIQRLAQQGQLNRNRDSLGSLLRGFFEYYAQTNMMTSAPKRGFDWGRAILSLRTHGGLLSKADKGWTGAKTVVHVQNKAPLTPAELAASTAPGSMSNGRMTGESPSQRETTQSPDQPTAKTKEYKEVRHRFLFAIEDPFEIEHNVARTVTHNGIVSIRNEFRRAWRIIKSAGDGSVTENLLEDVKAQKEQSDRQEFLSLLSDIHGNELYDNSLLA